jgi:phospholipase C
MGNFTRGDNDAHGNGGRRPMTQPLPGIEHIIVLMFENRSFDNMLGGLYPERSREGSYHGLTGEEWNPDPRAGNQPVYVWQGPTAHTTAVMPYPDPGELFSDMHQQISGSGTPMQGFVANYLEQPSSPDGVPPVARDIMQYYAPGPTGNIPVTSALAGAYAVSDLWFASGPVQTLANRIFAHCATPSAYHHDGAWHAILDNTDITHRHLDPDGTVTATPVFKLLDDAARRGGWPWPDRLPWKVYYHDWPLSAIVKYVDDNWAIFEDGRVYQFDGNFADDSAGDLPTYCFIEPRYTDYFGGVPNSNHPGGSTLHEAPPPISVCDGEQLLKDVYTTLYNAPGDLFAKTLLIVVYDEHGGLYDHMAPPPAVSPFRPGSVAGYDYSGYGVRVPAIFIHPSIQPGTIFRPPAGGPPFDHTSIISTLREQFGLGAPLTPRDATAPTLANLIDPNRPANPFSPADLPAFSCPRGAVPAVQPRDAAPRPGSIAAIIGQATQSPKNQGRVRRSRG